MLSLKSRLWTGRKLLTDDDTTQEEAIIVNLALGQSMGYGAYHRMMNI
jgi:hypothetical protein